MANAEVFRMIAAVVRYETVLFGTGKEDVEFRHDLLVAMQRLDS